MKLVLVTLGMLAAAPALAETKFYCSALANAVQGQQARGWVYYDLGIPQVACAYALDYAPRADKVVGGSYDTTKNVKVRGTCADAFAQTFTGAGSDAFVKAAQGVGDRECLFEIVP